MNEQEILDSKPKGNFKSVIIQPHAITWGPHEYRAILDIQTIVDLRRENAELKQERQSIIDQHDMWKQQWHELNESLPKRNLEQQIKALKGFANTNGILRQEPSTRSLNELIMELEKELSEALESDND